MNMTRTQLIGSGVLVILIAAASLGALALGRDTARGARPVVVYGIEAPAKWRVTSEDGANGRAGPGFAGDIAERLAFGEVVAATGRVAQVQREVWREVALADGEVVWVLHAFLAPVGGEPVTPPTTLPPTTLPPTTLPPTTTPPTTQPPTTQPPTTQPPTTVPPTPVYGNEQPGVWQVKGIAKGEFLNVRSGPGTANPVVARLAHDAAQIESTGRVARIDGSNWREVEYRAAGKGWVSVSYLERYVAPKPQPVFGTEKPALWDVTGLSAGDSLNVRSAPGTDSQVVARLRHDARAVAATGKNATLSGTAWRQVKYNSSGATGWVSTRFLKAHVPDQPKPTPPPPPPPGIIVMGDWKGTGVRTPAVFRDGVWHVRFSNSAGPADLVFEFGAAGDRPVAGDWDGNGTETPGVFRKGVWHLRNSNSSGGADLRFEFGAGGDVPLVGDWDDDGVDTPGVFRKGSWHLRNTNNGGPADVVFTYGDPGDTPVAGDWDGDGRDTPGVVRGNRWLLRNANERGGADVDFTFGDRGDKPIAGDWDGNGVDGPGVVRGSTSLHLRNQLSSGGASVSFTYQPASK